MTHTETNRFNQFEYKGKLMTKLMHSQLLLALILTFATACGPDENNNNNTSNGTTDTDMSGEVTDEDMGGEVTDEDMGEEATERDTTPITTPDTYTFDSVYVSDKSSVAHSGQTSRHTTITALNDYISGTLENDALTNTLFTSKQDFVDALKFYYELKGEDDPDREHTLTVSPATEGATWTLEPTTHAGISADGRLASKFAGNDSVTDYKNWFMDFQGWEGQISAEGLLFDLMDQLADQAFALSEGTAPVNPMDDSALPVYVTPEGLDLKQLIQKFLLMGITYAQAADDYLDDDPANEADKKGLFASNTLSEGKSYTGLEHVWDEGFGYFGAAADYDQYTDEQLSDGLQRDSDGDGVINVLREYNFGASINAAKRDKGSADSAKTDFTQATFDAFVEGRTLIVNAGEEVSTEELDAIRVQRDIVLENWEKAIAATVVHYINDTLQEMEKHTAATGDYSHTEHAKVWSELKGFSLGFQFNRNSPMMEGTLFVDFHELVGNAPVLPSASEEDFAQYKADLVSARDILQSAYDFADANMGDEKGQNGW